MAVTCQTCGSRYWCHNEDVCKGGDVETAMQIVEDAIATEYIEIREAERERKADS